MGLDQLNVTSKELSMEEKEDLLDKLETKKYEFLKRGLPETHPDVEEVQKLLSTLKTSDIRYKIGTTMANRQATDDDFRKVKAVLPLNDFNRMVDLTAPKAEREPDVTTALWQQQKRATLVDRAYRKDYNAENIRKFQKKLQCKPMTVQMTQELKARQDSNLGKFNIHANRPELVAVKQYDPATYTGLTLL